MHHISLSVRMLRVLGRFQKTFQSIYLFCQKVYLEKFKTHPSFPFYSILIIERQARIITLAPLSMVHPFYFLVKGRGNPLTYQHFISSPETNPHSVSSQDGTRAGIRALVHACAHVSP